MIKPTLLLAMFALMTACSLERPHPEKALYAFETVDAPTRAIARTDVSIRVLDARVAPPFSSRAIQYKVAPFEFQPTYYHAWADDPGGLVTAAIIRGLRGSGAFDAVLDSSAAVTDGITLNLFVEALYADVTSPRSTICVLRVIATGTNADGTLVFSQPINADIEADSSRAEDVVEALNSGVTVVTHEISSALLATPETGP